jgi:hypothetical protein
VQEEDLWDAGTVKEEMKEEAAADEHEVCLERLVDSYSLGRTAIKLNVLCYT